jgi:hypothetical protein
VTDEQPGASGQSGGESGASGKSGESSEPGSGTTGATYSQEQVDRYVAEERRRAQSKYGDYDAIKSKLAEIEQAGQTELERAQQATKDAEAGRAAAVTQRNRLVVQSAVVSAAARAGALDPDVVVALLADRLSVTDEGELEDDVNAAVAKLLEDKPYLKGNGHSPHMGSADGGVHGRPHVAAGSPAGAMNDLMRRPKGG